MNGEPSPTQKKIVLVVDKFVGNYTYLLTER